MRSIERTLLAWILGALSLGSVLVALVTYRVTLEEMNEVFDADLQNVAEAVAAYHQSTTSAAGPVPAVRSPQRTATPTEYEIVTITWTLDGRRVYSSDSRVPVPFTLRTGLARARVDDLDWIVYTHVTPDGVAQAAQRVSARKEMAGESAETVLLPLAVLALGVAGLMVFGLRRGLRPLDAAARDIAARSASSLQPIPGDDAPRELMPLVRSINGLMARLGEAFDAQRRFLADAAHELRTPITALRLQHQVLAGATDDSTRQEAAAQLEKGIGRSQRLVEQLLQVSRSEPEVGPFDVQAIDLNALTQEVVASFSAKADRLNVDLGAIPAAGEAIVQGDPHQLLVLLNNLVDNALRHTPAGGTVDVGVELTPSGAILFVRDTGPGIPKAERPRVFDRFYRGKDAAQGSLDPHGSGLGLAIVQAIAHRHAAEVTLDSGPDGRGLVVRVMFGLRGPSPEAPPASGATASTRLP